MTNTISVGDIVQDREGTSPDGVVVNRPPVPTSEWHVQDIGPVALHNPDYPDDDRTIIVVYFDQLDEHLPNYTGGRPLPLSYLNSAGIDYYAFPKTRLRTVSSLEPMTLALEEIDPAPYHARNFSAAANADYIDAIADRGRPKPIPLVRDCGEQFEILNGHKRLWASYIAGLEEIPVDCIYLDDHSAAEYWARHHLEDYGPEERSVAIDRLQERLPATRVDQIVESHLSVQTDDSVTIATDGGHDG